MMSNAAWAKEQWQDVNLGDKRTNERAVLIGKRIAEKPSASLPAQMGSKTELQAAYRFLNKRAVSMNALLEPHIRQTKQQAHQEPVVLWIEDTTELDYTSHRNSKAGMDVIGDGKGYGLLLHSTLAVVPQDRRVLGLGAVQVFRRTKREGAMKGKGWRGTPESDCWKNSALAVGLGPEQRLWVHVGDRGADVFEFMTTCVTHNKHFLVRVQQNRRCTDDEESQLIYLKEHVRSLEAKHELAFQVNVSANKGRPAHQATLNVTWTSIKIAPPEQAPQEIREQKPFHAWVIRVWEPEPPENAEAIEWILLTSLPVKNLEQATEKVSWYTCRWICEDYHQCLKTGCQIEHTQLDHADDVERLLGFLAPTAVRLLQLRQTARQDEKSLAIQQVDAWMVKTLARLTNLDENAMTVKEFWVHVARLGGFLWRKSDGQPGWRTIWRGWHHLSILASGAQLFAGHNTS